MSNFRINDFSLLKVVDAEDVMDFNIIDDEIALTYPQYVDPADSEQAVWDSGTFEHKLNKVFASTELYELTPATLYTVNYSYVNVLIKQGYRLDDNFGLHLIIKSIDDEEILISKLLFADDFVVTGNRELIDGEFWLVAATVKIPNTSPILSTQVTEILNADITTTGPDIGLISNYPTELVPLVEEKPIPDYLTNIVEFDDNHYLTVGIRTTENKTVKQSILDYFELDIADIEILYYIKYGNADAGYKSIRISNEDNQYNDITIGLNLTNFVENDPIVEIFVSTEIFVDSKLIKRETIINTDLTGINPFIESNITHPTTNYPVAVTKETVINQTSIETKERTKIISIQQPIFAEFINKEIKFESKNIYFDIVTSESLLKINIAGNDPEQVLISKYTVDNKIYFDLSTAIPLTGNTTYELIEIASSRIIGSGDVTI